MMCLGEAGGGGLLELSLGDLLGSGVEVAEVEDSPENSALRIFATQPHRPVPYDLYFRNPISQQLYFLWDNAHYLA